MSLTLCSTNDGYVHWNKLRFYQRLPDGFDAKQAWGAIAMSRLQQYQTLPIRFVGDSSQMVCWSPPQQLEWLHKIDQQEHSGAIRFILVRMRPTRINTCSTR